MNLRKRFLNVYYKLPDGEEKNTIVVLNGHPLSWNVVKIEVDKGTSVGDECLAKLMRMEII